MWSYKGNYPTESLPHVIYLSNGDARSDNSSFTQEEIADAGYVEVASSPTITHLQILKWDLSGWKIIDNTVEATKLQWQKVREERDRRIKVIEWRVTRYLSFERQSKEQLDEIDDLDRYIQELRDVTKQSDPWNIDYPTGYETE